MPLGGCSRTAALYINYYQPTFFQAHIRLPQCQTGRGATEQARPHLMGTDRGARHQWILTALGGSGDFDPFELVGVLEVSSSNSASNSAGVALPGNIPCGPREWRPEIRESTGGKGSSEILKDARPFPIVLPTFRLVRYPGSGTDLKGYRFVFSWN